MSANGIANGIGSRCGRRKAGVGRSLALVAGLWALAGAAMATQAREFRAADIQDENYPTVLALRFMDQLVTEKTGGRHRMRIFHSRQLGEESQTIEQTRVGAIDMNRINVGAIGNYAQVVNVLALPFLFRSIDHLYKVIDGPIGDDILAAIEADGFVGLTFYDSGARSIYTATRPVRKLADLKGLRLRVQQSELMDKMVKALGAEPVPLAFGQVLTALQTKLVDGAETGAGDWEPPASAGIGVGVWAVAVAARPSMRAAAMDRLRSQEGRLLRPGGTLAPKLWRRPPARELFRSCRLQVCTRVEVTTIDSDFLSSVFWPLTVSRLRCINLL